MKSFVTHTTTGGDKYVTTYYIRDLAEGVNTTQYRLLDTRLGRWLSVDPLFEKYVILQFYHSFRGGLEKCMSR